MELDKIKQVIPNFKIENFNIFDMITFMRWETVFDYDLYEEHKNLLLTMTGSEGYEIQMEFVDVSSLKFQGNGQITGFYIKDMSVRGYDNSSKYEIGDYEEGNIEFYCRDIIIKKAEKVNSNEL